MTEEQKKVFAKAKDKDWFKVYAEIIAKEIENLKQEALMQYPSDNHRQDYYRSGFRHGAYVGMLKMIEIVEEANKEEVAKK